MYLSEWEIEDAIVWNHSIIEDHQINNLKLVERQRYLKTLGRYIDILFRWNERYVIVELKAVRIDERSIVEDQVIPYKQALARELGVDEQQIVCILATPSGFSQEIIDLCRQLVIITKELDERSLIQSSPRTRDGVLSRYSTDTAEESRLRLMLERRRIDSKSIVLDDDNIAAVRSAKTWLTHKIHDEFGKKMLAELFKEVSSKAPIMAHEVFSGSDGKLRSDSDKWFWLFYSVMDRRANAASFINARNALDRQDLFNPRRILSLVQQMGEDEVRKRIVELLEDAEFALLVDSTSGKYAYPKSIIDAAKLIAKYDYSFDKMYLKHYERSNGNLEKTFRSIWKELTSKIYGVGPRIAAQFIRGMVLKDSWNLPLTDNSLLEKTSLNARFAGSPRFSLIDVESSYESDLGKFADEYLDGNRAVLSHVLWYIRKRYCDKVPLCYECPMTGYCTLFMKLSSSGALDSKYRLKAVPNRAEESKSQTTLTAFANE